MEQNAKPNAEHAKPSGHAGAAWAALLVPSVVGLVGSTLLLVDYVRPAPVFCSYDGGCDAVKHTAYASILGLPTPLLGVATFALFGVLALLRGRFARIALFFASFFAAPAAVFLVSVQAKMGAYCIYCMTVDLATVVVLLAATWRLRAGWDPPEPTRIRARGGVALALALAVPALVGFVKKPNVPDVIAAEIAKTPPEKVTVVDFVDYECPFCREMHSEIAPILASKKDKLRIVRRNVPLSRIHPHAMDAALGACCGEIMGRGDAFADAMMMLPETELTPAGCEKVAAQLGLDVGAFKSCVSDPKTAVRIQSDMADFKSSQGHGLPTLWIDEERLEGGQSAEAVEGALNRALARKKSG